MTKKLTKAQARKRIEECANKVALVDVYYRDATPSMKTQIHKIRMELGKLVAKFKA